MIDWNFACCRLNEEMIETLFMINNSNLNSKDNKARRQIVSSLNQENQVLDPKKSQNIAILLRALNVTIDEVCEALLEGKVVFAFVYCIKFGISTLFIVFFILCLSVLRCNFCLKNKSALSSAIRFKFEPTFGMVLRLVGPSTVCLI